MTPATIETAARRKYNLVGSSFVATAEIYDLIYQAELELAAETDLLEEREVISGGSVDGQQNYSYPTGVSRIRRVEYNGAKLEKIDFDEDDATTLFNSNSTTEGTPIYYYDWDNTIYLRPIPSSSGDQIRIYHYKEPTAVTTPAQVLEVPTIFHMCLVDFVVAEMCYKDQNFSAGDRYMARWTDVHIPRVKRWVAKKRRTEGFKVVKDVETIISHKIGRL
jgi:hypothetical protein